MINTASTWIALATITSCLIFTQGCYLFCLFDQDKATEVIIEQIIEEKIINNEGKKTKPL